MSVSTLQTYFRTRRNRRLAEIVAQLATKLGRPIRVLDVGGRPSFWRTADTSNIARITVTNIEKSDYAVDPDQSLIEGEYADTLDLSAFASRSYDLVVSNSVIEHLETWRNMKTCARELRSVAPVGFIQTPSFWFPVEQHYMIPFFHWLPNPLRVLLLPYLPRRSYKDTRNVDVLRTYIEEINLLRKPELEFLFPDATVHRERFLGFTKSYVVIWGA